MKKKLLAILLCTVMLVCLLPAPALAAVPIEVFVGDELVSTDAYATLTSLYGGRVKYDAASNVLTLDSVTVPDGAETSRAAIYANGDLTIELIGTNTVTGPSDIGGNNYGVSVWNPSFSAASSLTIQSTDGTGVLNVSGTSTLYGPVGAPLSIGAGIYVNGGSLEVKSGTVNAVGAGSAESGACGIYVGGGITVSGSADVSGECTGSAAAYSYGIYANGGDITVSGGSLTGEGATSNANSYGIYANGGDVTVSGGSVEGTSGAAGAGNYNSEGIYVNGGELSVSGGTVTGTGAAAEAASSGVHVTGDITVSGGSLKGEGKTSNDFNSYGIHTSHGDSITVTGGKVEGIGGTAHELSLGISVGSGSVTDGTVIARANTSALSGRTLPDLGTELWYKWRKTSGGTYTKSSVSEIDIAQAAPYDTYIEITPDFYIRTQPSDRTVTAGSVSGTLSVQAAGTSGGNATYQWYMCDDLNKTNPYNIDGETSPTLTIPANLEAGRNYYFYCVVTLDSETITSDVATVTVRTPSAPPQPQPQPQQADNPKTGDAAAPWLWAGALLLAGAGLAWCILRKRNSVKN